MFCRCCLGFGFVVDVIQFGMRRWHGCLWVVFGLVRVGVLVGIDGVAMGFVATLISEFGGIVLGWLALGSFAS